VKLDVFRAGGGKALTLRMAGRMSEQCHRSGDQQDRRDHLHCASSGFVAPQSDSLIPFSAMSLRQS
jgi:hypothetical protein